MAGGIDWFRWHHGCVTDPKFGLVAKKAGVRVSDVIAVWAFILENASAETDRGSVGQLDFEAIEHLFGLDDGQAVRILDAMTQRGLIAGNRIAAWEKRQPKREDDTAADRQRRKRERDHAEKLAQAVTEKASRDVTQDHADVTHCHDRGEESREEIDTSPDGDVGKTAGAVVADCPQQQIIDLYHRLLPMGRQVRDWTPARASALRARWRDKPARQKLEWWERFFAYCAESDFLTGKVNSPGRKPFVLSLDWLVKAENMTKVIEGAYENEREAA